MSIVRLVHPLESLIRRITAVIEDAESQHPGGWGPDVTTVQTLREALDQARAALALAQEMSA